MLKSNDTNFTIVLYVNYFISHLVALIVTLNDPYVMNWKHLEGNGQKLIEILSRYILEGQRPNTMSLSYVADDSYKI